MKQLTLSAIWAAIQPPRTLSPVNSDPKTQRLDSLPEQSVVPCSKCAKLEAERSPSGCAASCACCASDGLLREGVDRPGSGLEAFRPDSERFIGLKRTVRHDTEQRYDSRGLQYGRALSSGEVTRPVHRLTRDHTSRSGYMSEPLPNELTRRRSIMPMSDLTAEWAASFCRTNEASASSAPEDGQAGGQADRQRYSGVSGAREHTCAAVSPSGIIQVPSGIQLTKSYTDLLSTRRARHSCLAPSTTPVVDDSDFKTPIPFKRYSCPGATMSGYSAADSSFRPPSGTGLRNGAYDNQLQPLGQQSYGQQAFQQQAPRQAADQAPWQAPFITPSPSSENAKRAIASDEPLNRKRARWANESHGRQNETTNVEGIPESQACVYIRKETQTFLSANLILVAPGKDRLSQVIPLGDGPKPRRTKRQTL